MLDYSEGMRGHIQSERAKQVIDFRGLQYGNCTPTDIDGFFEWNDKVYAFFELKYRNRQLPFGQRTAFVRLTDNLRKCGKTAAVFVASHDVGDPNIHVIAAEALVIGVYYEGQWYDGHCRRLKDMMDAYVKWSGVA